MGTAHALRVACVQTRPRLGLRAENLAGVLAAIARVKANLLVFPECALTGYGFGSPAQALPHAEQVPGPFSGMSFRIRVFCSILAYSDLQAFSAMIGSTAGS